MIAEYKKINFSIIYAFKDESEVMCIINVRALKAYFKNKKKTILNSAAFFYLFNWYSYKYYQINTFEIRNETGRFLGSYSFQLL